jgi:hypothetical protein
MFILSPGIYPAKIEKAWAGAIPERRQQASGSGRARGAQTGVAPAHAPTLLHGSLDPWQAGALSCSNAFELSIA